MERAIHDNAGTCGRLGTDGSCGVMTHDSLLVVLSRSLYYGTCTLCAVIAEFFRAVDVTCLSVCATHRGYLEFGCAVRRGDNRPLQLAVAHGVNAN